MAEIAFYFGNPFVSINCVGASADLCNQTGCNDTYTVLKPGSNTTLASAVLSTINGLAQASTVADATTASAITSVQCILTDTLTAARPVAFGQHGAIPALVHSITIAREAPVAVDASTSLNLGSPGLSNAIMMLSGSSALYLLAQSRAQGQSRLVSGIV